MTGMTLAAVVMGALAASFAVRGMSKLRAGDAWAFVIGECAAFFLAVGALLALATAHNAN